MSRVAVIFAIAATAIGAMTGAARATPVEEAPVYTIDDYPYQKAPALKQWRSVLERSAADEAQANPDNCDDGAPELDCAAKAAHQLEENLKEKSAVEQIYGVYSFFNAIKWKEHGLGCTEDCWKTRLQFITRRYGDCGDHALAEYFTLKRLGFQERDLQLIVAQLPGYEDSFKGGHVVLRVASGGKYYILDNRRHDVTGLKGLDNYKVLAGLNAESVQIYNLVTPKPPVGFVADETKIAELIDSPGTLPKKIAPAPSEQPEVVLASAEPASAPVAVTESATAPAPETDDDTALMDCTQTASLGDWNPNQPCSAYEMPAKPAKAKDEKADKMKPTLVAELTPPATDVEAAPTVAAAPAKSAKPKAAAKSTTKTAAKPAAKPKTVKLASAKDTQKPAKKKKKKKKHPVDDGGSCVQGASTIADWNPNLPCATGETAARLKLVDVPPAL